MKGSLSNSKKHNTPSWFNIQKFDGGIFLIEEPKHVNSFLVCGTQQAALIDTGMGFCNIREVVETLTPLPVIVLNTHWHFDHIGGNALFDSRGIARVEKHLVEKNISSTQLAPVYIDACLQQGYPFPANYHPALYSITGAHTTFEIEDGAIFDLGGRTLRAISTPGHTRGSFSFLDSKTRRLFCGDLIYQGTLYAQFVDSDLDAYVNSLQKLLRLCNQITGFFVSHGPYEFPKSQISPVLEALQLIQSGAVPCSIQSEEGDLVSLYEVNGVRVFGPQKGTAGVNLFGFVK